jgi:hypothetical protein
VSEFPVSPETLEWLISLNEPIGLTREEVEEGDIRAQAIIQAWAQTPKEIAFLEALSAGHEIAEARRISGLSHSGSDRLLRRIRGGT